MLKLIDFDLPNLKIWDADLVEKQERRISNIRGHRGFIASAAFSTTEPRSVITSSEDQTIKIWDLDCIKNRKPPNKKRNKHQKNGEDDDDDEDDDDEDDA